MSLLNASIRNSPGLKIFFIGFLVLILLIPMDMIEALIYQRSQLYEQANGEITKVWGGSHTLVAPMLTIPQLSSGKKNLGWGQTISYKHIVAESLNISADFQTQLRYRGIYKVPVYLGDLSIKGKFIVAEASDTQLLDKVLLQFPFSNVNALKKIPNLIWNGKPLALTAIGDSSDGNAVIFQASITAQEMIQGEFEISYQVAGSSTFNIQSLAKRTRLQLSSNWGSPSFQGESIPTRHNIQADGFTAIWDINKIFTKSENSSEEIISTDWLSKQETFGVNFIQPADTYQMLTRSAKYAILFISLTFTIYFLIEIIGANKLHFVQYLFIGLGNCIFYLLLLSLAEHIKFGAAYFLSACASSLLISLYSKSVLQNTYKAFVIFFVLTALYIFLFVTLQSEGFALITGSVGLFLILATLMYITRHTDWHTRN